MVVRECGAGAARALGIGEAERGRLIIFGARNGVGALAALLLRASIASETALSSSS